MFNLTRVSLRQFELEDFQRKLTSFSIVIGPAVPPQQHASNTLITVSFQYASKHISRARGSSVTFQCAGETAAACETRNRVWLI